MDKEVVAACFALIVALCNPCAAETSLTSSNNLCVGEEVEFVCSVTGSFLEWEVRTPTSVYRTTYLPSHSEGRQVYLGMDRELVFNLTSTAPLVSTLTTTLTPALIGTEVDCTGTTFETLTLQELGHPSPPASPTITVTGQTINTTSATITVQWAPSTGADSYTVSVTPDLPSLGGPVTTTDTSLELQDVPYSTPYTVSIVATNCVGSSAAAETVINTTGCVVPVSPVNGDWQTFSPSTTVGPGTSLSLSCSPGSVPSEVMSSTCQSDGSWDPDTAELECVTVDCGSPTIASGVVLEPSSPNTTLNSTFLFRCAEGLFPNTTHEAVCGDDSQWRPDPANHNCGDEDAVDCGPPILANGVVLELSIMPNTTLNSTFTFRCEGALFPSAALVAVCGADGLWRPDPANHTCMNRSTEPVDCGAPQPPASGSIAPHSSTLEGAVISFQCDQGFSPPEERPATCVRDEDTGSAVWEPNPAEHTCSRNETGITPTTIATMGGTNVELSTGSVAAITAVLCSVVFFLLGTVCGMLIHYCLSSTAKRRAQYSVSSSSTEPQTPAPVYEEISGTDNKPKAIELSENIAYGPTRR